MRRLQARRGNGRFTRNTMENTFGLHCAICPHPDCGALNPSPVGEPRPTRCHRCGGDLHERSEVGSPAGPLPESGSIPELRSTSRPGDAD